MKTNEYPLLTLVDEFISKNNRNKRTQAGGKRLAKGTKLNYMSPRRHLASFTEKSGFELRVKSVQASKRTFEQEKNYYKKFYTKFTDFLFDKCNHYDNYVRGTIKQFRVIMSWQLFGV